MDRDTFSSNFESYGAASGACRAFICLLLLGVLIPLTLYVRRDYQSFLDLGPGGTPQDFRGYLRVKVLGLFALRDPYAATLAIPGELSPSGCLKELATRKWPRPETRGIAPHRQIDQRSGKQIFEKLAERIKKMAPGEHGELCVGTSCFEKHGTGLFSTCPANQTCRGEIVHVHPSDGSMHLTLHPADANVVLKSGWGERHPLAGVFYNRFLPRGFLMLYAPQSEEEIEVVLRVVRAACWFVCDDEGKQEAMTREEGAWPEKPSGSRAAKDGHGRGNVRQVEDPSRALEKLLPSMRKGCSGEMK